MSRTLGIFSLVLLTWALVQAETSSSTESHTETETTEYGPISMVVDQLADMAVDVSDKTSSQLQANVERALTDIADSIEAMTTSAMDELSIAIDDTNQLLLANPNCNAAWNLQDFTLNVTDQLRDCTGRLSSLMAASRTDGQQVLATVQSFVQQMAQLPLLCQNQSMSAAIAPVGLSFGGGGSSCFLRGISAINQGLAQAMHSASLLLVRTRRLSQEQVVQAQQCSNAVVAEITEYLRVQRANCG